MLTTNTSSVSACTARLSQSISVADENMSGAGMVDPRWRDAAA